FFILPISAPTHIYTLSLHDALPIYAARPDVIAAAHAHSVYGKAWSALGRPLDPITQDSCAFYDDHVLFDDFTGVVLDTEEGKRRSEEHTSELQSREKLVCRLLLEKK